MPVPFNRQRVQRKCLPHTLDKLSSETPAPSEGPRTYGSCETCPDIAFMIGQPSKPKPDSQPGHVRAARRVVRYLKGSIDPEDHKSVLGCCCFMGVALVSRSNKKQHTLSAPTDNAKYIALGRALRASMWMGRLLNEMGLGMAGEFMLNGDRVTMSRAYR